MQTSVFDSFSRRISIQAITGYQRYISPHKGFKCAHRVLHGGESCSQYVKRVIANHGLKAAFVKSQERFQSCKHANQILRSSQTENPELPEENEEIETPNTQTAPIKNPRNSLFSNNDSTYCIDCGAADCSSLDCGAADCSSLDCGGCSW